MSPTGDLLVTFIFVWGGVSSSLLRSPRVLHWHGTLPGAAHPSGKQIRKHHTEDIIIRCCECLRMCGLRTCVNAWNVGIGRRAHQRCEQRYFIQYEAAVELAPASIAQWQSVSLVN